MTLGALIAALALALALSAMLFWQMRRAAKAVSEQISYIKVTSELSILSAADKVALADKERAMNMLIAERDRMQFALDTVEDQRDELLQEALESGSPGAVAHALRDALNRLQPPEMELSEEDMSDVPGGADRDSD
jgi:hypothetical protein